MIGAIGTIAGVTAGGGAERRGSGFGDVLGKAEESEAQRIDRLREAIGGLRKEAELTPAQRIRRDVLEKLGLTEDSLKELPKERREHVEKQVAAEIERRLGTARAEERGPRDAVQAG